MSTHYAQAIENLSRDLDWYTLAKEWAKRSPSSFNKMVKIVTGPSFEDKVREIAATNKIQAIQYVRHWEGLGLKEAKEFVEALK